MKKLRYAVLTVVWDSATMGCAARGRSAVGAVATLLTVLALVVSTAVATVTLPAAAVAVCVSLTVPVGALAVVMCSAYVSPGVEMSLRRRWFAAADAVGVTDGFRPLP